MINRQSKSRISVAPYNFVSLPKKVYAVDELAEYTVNLPDGKRELWNCHDIYIPYLNHGRIDIHITTETPTYIWHGPGESESSNERLKSSSHQQDFFHHGNRNHPVIPGSTIRGATRMLVEIVSSGKITDVFNQRFLYRAVGEVSSLGSLYRSKMLYMDGTKQKWAEYPRREMRGGYLEQDGLGWAIRPAVEHNGESMFHVTYDAINISGHDPEKEYDSSDIIRVLVKPPRRFDYHGKRRFMLNMALVHDPCNIIKTKDLTESQQRSYLKRNYVYAIIVRSGEIHDKVMHCAIYEPDKDAKLISIPSWMYDLYQEDRSISRGKEGREIRSPYNHLFFITEKENESDDNPAGLMFFGPTMMFRIPYKYGILDHIPEALRNTNITDVAEALFGTNSKDKPIKGRVLFEDAVWDGKGTPFLDGADGLRVTKQQISHPKPLAFQHYLEQSSMEKNDLKHWDDKDARIRGYKLYWHKRGISDNDILTDDTETLENAKKDPRQRIIRPVRAGITFVGRIHFENLTDFELGALCFVLQLPESKRHKLGMAKSLGMGSVKIIATVSMLDHQQRYSSMFSGDSLELGYKINETTAKHKSAFIKSMIDHYGEDVDDIWSVSRMRELSELLEWKNGLDHARTRYLPFLEWRNRLVLPRATDVKAEDPPPEPSKSFE